MKFVKPIAVLFGLLISGCQTAPTVALTQLPIPGNSAVMLPKGSSYLVGQDVYSKLKARISQKYGCEKFTIEKVEKSGGTEDLAIDKDGRLWGGIISEGWSISMCGSAKNFGLVITPDGKGGIFLAIGE